MTDEQRALIVRDPLVCHGQATVRGTGILVRDPDGTAVALGPAGEQPPATDTPTRRRRYRADRTIASVLAEDRGA